MVSQRWSAGQSKGNVWDAYSKVGTKVSAGGFGFVTKAASADGAHYAIKSVPKLPESKSKRRRTAERLQQEVALMRRVQHPQHVVNLHETFEDEHFVYLVMELCQGGELAAFILEQGNHTEFQVALVMRQVFAAVAFLHSCNVCHRDLKPENLLLLHRCRIQDNVLKVADFGLAAVCTSGLQGVAGTLPYMAPQVLTGRYDLAVDMWSCAVIMYLLLCGYPPFWHEFDPQKTEMTIRRGNFAFPEQDWGSVSEEAKTLIRGLLKMQPTERLAAKEACQNPWVMRSSNDVSLSPALTRLRKFLKAMYATQVQSAEDLLGNDSSTWRSLYQSVTSWFEFRAPSFFAPCCNQSAGIMEEVHLVPSDIQATGFAIGMRVLYNSRTHHRWLPTVIVDLNDHGDVELEIKPRVWISPKEQSTLLRSVESVRF